MSDTKTDVKLLKSPRPEETSKPATELMDALDAIRERRDQADRIRALDQERSAEIDQAERVLEARAYERALEARADPLVAKVLDQLDKDPNLQNVAREATSRAIRTRVEESMPGFYRDLHARYDPSAEMTLREAAERAARAAAEASKRKASSSHAGGDMLGMARAAQRERAQKETAAKPQPEQKGLAKGGQDVPPSSSQQSSSGDSTTGASAPKGTFVGDRRASFESLGKITSGAGKANNDPATNVVGAKPGFVQGQTREINARTSGSSTQSPASSPGSSSSTASQSGGVVTPDTQKPQGGAGQSGLEDFSFFADLIGVLPYCAPVLGLVLQMLWQIRSAIPVYWYLLNYRVRRLYNK